VEKWKPFIIGLAVFVPVCFLTQVLTYQQFRLHERALMEKVSHEANAIGNRLKTSLANSLSATKTLAFIIEKYGDPVNFDTVASGILRSNKFIDALELTRKGVITNVYPLQGNEDAIGYDVLADVKTNQEALLALQRRQLYFAGPLELKQGGMAVVGRLPIFRNGEFYGFSVVIIKLSTLLAAAGIVAQNESPFNYQLSKVNPSTDKEEFFMDTFIPSNDDHVSIDVPDGAWKLYVAPKERTPYLTEVFPFLVLGLILSGTAGLFAWYLAKQPERLTRKVDQVTRRLLISQENLQNVNRLYHFISRINHIVVHATDEVELYEKVCATAVDIGNFKMAWLGLIDEKSEKMFVAAKSGDDLGYLDDIAPIALDKDAPEGPAMRMIKTGSYVHCNDISTDPLMNKWAQKALARGYCSSMLLPIRKSGKIIGSLNLYSPESNCFDSHEVNLLLETANNISFAVNNFERERERKKAEDQIQSEKFLSDSIINSLPGVFYLYNRDGKFLRWNKNMEEVTGYSSEEVQALHPLDFFTGDQRELLKKKIDSVFENGYDDVIADFHGKNNSAIPFYFNGRRICIDGTDYLIGMGIDISTRLEAERALLERNEEIEKLSAHLHTIREEERSRISLEIHDILGQQLTALKMDATWLKKRLDEKAMTDRISTMLLLIDDTIKTVRRISSDLRPGILDDLGLVAALEWQGSEFEKNTGIPLRFHSNKQEIALSRNFSTNVFRIYQEALTNIARHAQASNVSAQLTVHEQNIDLTIADDGRGIDFDEIKVKKSLGLISMKERARMLDGELTLEKNHPRGTMVTLKLPIPKPNIEK
jgi:PAS domain S-box-containing protein